MGKANIAGRFTWVEHLIESTFNLAYKFNMSPFKVKFDDKQGTYVMENSKFRKCSCFLQLLITGTFAIISVNSIIARVSLSSPGAIFRVATQAGDTFLCCMFWYVTCFRQEESMRYFALLVHHRSEKWGKGWHHSEIHMKGKTLALIVCSLSVLILGICEMLELFAEFQNTLDKNGVKWNSLFGLIHLHISRGVFQSREGQPLALTLEEMDGFQLALPILALVAETSFRFTNAFSISLCLAGLGVVFKKSFEFTNYLHYETDGETFVRKLQVYKEEVESINKVIGPIMFGIAIVVAPPFFIANFVRLLTIWDVRSLFHFITWVIYSVILKGASEVSYMTDEICDWIVAYDEDAHEDELFGVFVELTQSPIGIRGMECLTVTYRYMAQMITAVVTFVIILLQFTSAPGQEWVLTDS